ncbi:GNAT family N-acetyltransferase [Diaminobutyricibacter tongyongensis]|uniref:GNAT family N-acetyltransferase n=1 Tax=Leifsonia tongyongensis TaxID=1268043 RepID=A0A6L9XX32_9MICO|nr:GNAT family N-acetyltransferase [Diaminobutyricibacter tongyongensis]NEN05614.1 GNAT family N-acetyltransferase [Diaminobutyricibacter tongyongensis]
MDFRVATAVDVDAVTETITLAFRDDPIWGVALVGADGGTAHCRRFWQLYVEGAVRYSTVFMADDASTVAVWLPPGAGDLTAEQQQEVDELIAANLSPEHARAYDVLWERFETSHPDGPPHMYLSLLATHPDHRGLGIGQQLLADNLAAFDADGLPAYLESTNPANDHRYERAGFRPIGRFQAVIDDATVTTMWRDAPNSRDAQDARMRDARAG